MSSVIERSALPPALNPNKRLYLPSPTGRSRLIWCHIYVSQRLLAHIRTLHPAFVSLPLCRAAVLFINCFPPPPPLNASCRPDSCRHVDDYFSFIFNACCRWALCARFILTSAQNFVPAVLMKYWSGEAPEGEMKPHVWGGGGRHVNVKYGGVEEMFVKASTGDDSPFRASTTSSPAAMTNETRLLQHLKHLKLVSFCSHHRVIICRRTETS